MAVSKELEAKKTRKLDSDNTRGHFSSVKILVIDILAMGMIILLSLFFVALLTLPQLHLLYDNVFGFYGILILVLIISTIICLVFGFYLYKRYKKVKTINRNGWALTLAAFIITVVIIASLIYFISSFISSEMGQNNLLGSQCIASSGYLCQDSVYPHTSSSILITVGQDTGTNWATANFVFVPQGTQTNDGIPLISFNSYPANTFYSIKGIVSGSNGITQIWLQINGVTAPVPVGTVATGSIWVEYTTNSSQTPQYQQIAIINIKAS